MQTKTNLNELFEITSREVLQKKLEKAQRAKEAERLEQKKQREEGQRRMEEVNSPLKKVNKCLHTLISQCPAFVEYLVLLTKNLSTYDDKFGLFGKLPPLVEVVDKKESEKDSKRMSELMGKKVRFKVSNTNFFSRCIHVVVIDLWVQKFPSDGEHCVELSLAIPYTKSIFGKMILNKTKICLVHCHHDFSMGTDDYNNSFSYNDIDMDELTAVLQSLSEVKTTIEYFIERFGTSEEIKKRQTY